jgi:ribosomal protein L22
MAEPEESVARKLPISLDKFREVIGRIRGTVYRSEKDGLLQTYLIYNRRYVRAEVVEEFMRRAEAGEFAKPGHKPRRKMVQKTDGFSASPARGQGVCTTSHPTCSASRGTV